MPTMRFKNIISHVRAATRFLRWPRLLRRQRERTATRQPPQASDPSSSQNRATEQDLTSAQRAATASPYILPVELLIEVFGHLNTVQVARAAQVCRTWYAASRDWRVWRNLGFPLLYQAPWLPLSSDARAHLQHELIKSICARTNNAIESVELDKLYPQQAFESMEKELEASAQTLKHIRWSSNPGDEDSVRSVMRLAALCPQLETLELCLKKLQFTLNVPSGLQGDFSRLSTLANLRCFRLIVSRSRRVFDFAVQTTRLFDHVTTFEVVLERWDSTYSPDPLILVQDLWALLEKNPAIERLTAHGLQGSATHSISAPSLKFLDVRYSQCSWSRSVLNAPALRKLAIDAVLVPGLTPVSTATLSSLHLRMVGDGEAQLPGELDGLNRVKSHRGSLHVTVSLPYTDDVLTLLSEGFCWPGLQLIEIEVIEPWVNKLISIIVARQAGFEGASIEQYLETIRASNVRLQTAWDSRWPRDSGKDVAAEAEMLMAAARARREVGSRPLCSRVYWSISARDLQKTSVQVRNWLRHQPNVDVRGGGGRLIVVG